MSWITAFCFSASARNCAANSRATSPWERHGVRDPKAVEDRKQQQRVFWRLSDCALSSTFAFGFQYRLRHFLDEQRNAIGTLDNVLSDTLGQRLVARNTLDHGGDIAFPKPVESKGGDMRTTDPRRLKLRSIRDD
jgi:hypothetical protein